MWPAKPKICTAWLFNDLYMKALKNVLHSFLFFKDIWCRPLFKGFIEFIAIFFLWFMFFFFFFFATRNLSSLTKDQTHTPALKGKVLTTGPPTKSLHSWWSSLMIVLYYVSWCCYCCSVATSCLTLHNPMDCSRPGFWCYCPKLASWCQLDSHFPEQQRYMGSFNCQKQGGCHW